MPNNESQTAIPSEAVVEAPTEVLTPVVDVQESKVDERAEQVKARAKIVLEQLRERNKAQATPASKAADVQKVHRDPRKRSKE